MFITLEGIEGSGKSTQIPHIVEYMEKTGRSCMVTKEPGGTPIGEKIRGILLDPDNTDLDAMAELLLYGADRAQHVNCHIKPALAKGKTVICDRFMDSTVVYQGAARGIDAGIIKQMNRLVLGRLNPDLTILLDLPAEVGLSRAWQQIDKGMRSQGETRFERETLAFHQRVRQGYLELAALEPARIRIVSADAPAEQVRSDIIDEIKRALHRPDS